MNLELKKMDNGLSGRLTVNLVEDDYRAQVTARLKEINRTRQIPGFRKGHVPMSRLEKMFGESVLADVLNDTVYKAVTDYIRDNKINILGEPMPVEVKAIDFKKDKEFTFEYDLILGPELTFKVDKDSLDVTEYKTIITPEMIAEEDERLRRRYGKRESGETTQTDSVVKGLLVQLNDDDTPNENEGAIRVDNAIVAPFTFKDKEQTALFADKKVGDTVIFNPWKTCEGNEAEMSSMLNIDREIARDVHSNFGLTISEIINLVPAEENQELYNEAFGPDRVHNHEEYEEALKQRIAFQIKPIERYLLQRDIRAAVMDKWADLVKLDEPMLRRWLNKEGEEMDDERFQSILPDIRWEILSNYIAEQLQVKVTQDDVKAVARNEARNQFMQYGMTNPDEETVNVYADRMLQDRDFANRLAQACYNNNLFSSIANAITLTPKEVSFEQLQAMA